MKIKMLAVEFPLLGRDATTASFYDAYSFSDYDVLVIDPADISEKWEKKVVPHSDGSLHTYFRYDGGFGKSLLAIMEVRRWETELLLQVTGGIVVCFLRLTGTHLQLSDDPSHPLAQKWLVDRYSWLPVNLDLSYCVGQEIGEIDRQHSFSQYFTEFKNDICFEVRLASSHSCRSIAKNKVGEIIAAEVPFGQGKFIFLPPLAEGVERKRLSAILIDCIHKSLGWTISLAKPDWADKYEVPGELEARREIEGVEVKMSKLTEELEKSQERLRNLEMIKSLLYGQGKYVLEPAVRRAFRILGFNVLQPEEYEEEYDLYAPEDDLVVIGEVEGTLGQIDIKKYRQLLDYVERESEKGKKCKGVLIGNGYWEEKPEERGEQFTSEAILGARRQKFCRMTTFELFKSVCYVLAESSKEEIKQSIKQSILSCEDEFKFDQQ